MKRERGTHNLDITTNHSHLVWGMGCKARSAVHAAWNPHRAVGSPHKAVAKPQ